MTMYLAGGINLASACGYGSDVISGYASKYGQIIDRILQFANLAENSIGQTV